MIVRARVLLPVARPPIADGALVMRGTRIVAVGRWADIRKKWGREKVEDLGEQVLLPGLINAHCHLDYTLLRKAISPPKDFTAWIRSINGLKRTFDEADYLRAIRTGIEESQRWGTTTLYNIESFPDLLAKMERPPLRIWWFAELLDIRFPVTDIDFKLPKGWLGGAGLSPHAPYTASEDVFLRARRSGRLVTTHLAESADEARMFRHAGGPLFELLAKVGRPMDDCGRRSVVRHVLENKLVSPETLLAHVNEVERGDLRFLRGANVVHCPRSHTYFRHRKFPWRSLRRIGANISLGTDSLASNYSLSLFEELRAARKMHEGVNPRELIRTVTVNPAAAIGKQGRLGELSPGALADLISLPFAGNISLVYEGVMENRHPIQWMVVNGRRL